MAEDKDNLQQIREELHDLNVKYKKLEIASQKKKNKFFNITNLWIPITSILVSIIIAKLTVDNELKIAREQLDLQNINTTQTLIANLLEKEEIITAKNKIQFYIKG